MTNGNGKVKLAIGYPHGGSVRHCFMDSLMRFREYDLGHNCLFASRIPAQGLYIATIRNNIVRDFLGTPCEWLMMIDTDQHFEPHIPYQLLDSALNTGARIMSALYFGILDGQLAPMWWNKVDGETYGTASTITDGVQRIDAFGCGMCLIHRSVFEEMAPHYQDDPWKWFGHDLTLFNGHMDRFGEDLCFCDRATKLGFEIYGDSHVLIGHDKQRIVTLDSFLLEAKPRKEGEPVVQRILDQSVV